MDSGFYAMCNALIARKNELDTIAGNLANTNTVGYRGHRDIFSSVLATAQRNTSPLNDAINDYGVLQETSLDQRQGSMVRTGNDLDLAVEGPGWLVVQTASGRVLTRNGNLQVSAHGQLVTAQGDAVMGERGAIPVVGGGPMSISSDGTISVNGAIAGKVKLVELTPGTAPEALGGSYYKVPVGSEVAATHSTLRQGMLEDSNVDGIGSMVALITVQRSAELAEKALAMLNLDMNKTAAQDLPRVNG